MDALFPTTEASVRLPSTFQVYTDVMDYYRLDFDDFGAHSKIPFNLVEDHEALNRYVARDIVGRIESNNRAGRRTRMILPVGPLDYSYLAALCIRKNVDLRAVTVYMMDEYLTEDGDVVPRDHPLSFRRYMDETLLDGLNGELGMSEEQIVLPTPGTAQKISEEIHEMEGVDVCYGGFGITGHFAFNDPPDPGDTEVDLPALRASRTRVVDISRESTTQMVMGGSHGNWDIVPDRAVSLGMSELLASDQIHLTFMRSWHAGVLRRALFGPVSVDCPGSLLQEHDNVRVTLTDVAARRPTLHVAQDTGE